MNILELIPTDRYITRIELQRLTGMKDRTIRKEIENLRNKGVFIISSDHHKGYKISSGTTEDNKLLAVYKSRVRTEFNTLKALMGEDAAIEWIMDRVVNNTLYTG
jgi:biotin operon repressor